MLAGADYRGHKGALRWVADYNLVHRYGFAVVAPGREPELLLPQNLAMGRPGRLGRADARSRATCARACRTRWRELGPLRRIGDRRARAR